MTLPETLGELRVARVLDADPVLPRFAAVHFDGRPMRAIMLALPGAELSETDAEQAAALVHPSIAAPRVWSRSPAFTAVDAIDGEPLSALAGKPVDADRVIAVAVDLAEALERAHGAGVVHGGVGLRSIVITRTGRAVLEDFAIARLASALVNRHSSVLASMAASLAPEQMDTAEVTAATDVFAAGSVLYRLLTGVHPFDVPSPLGMTLKMSMGMIEPVAVKAPRTPAPFAQLVERMLAKAPNERPSARDVAVALLAMSPREEPRRDALRRWVPARAEPVESVAQTPASPAPIAPAPRAPAPPPPRPEEWVESAVFDDGVATEFTPELAASIERDAGIASSFQLDARSRASRPSAPRVSSPRVNTPPVQRAPDMTLLYVGICAGAVVIAGVSIAIALAIFT
jgi:serine/threonine protein kinase